MHKLTQYLSTVSEHATEAKRVVKPKASDVKLPQKHEVDSLGESSLPCATSSCGKTPEFPNRRMSIQADSPSGS